MKIYTKKEWEREQYKGQWSDCPYNRDEVASGKLPAYYIGRRYVMVGGERGPMLITEGVHFLVEGDYSHLPTLHKSNALVGAMYRNGDGCFKLNRLYRITEEYAREHELTCLERVDTTAGDFALPGGDRLQEGCPKYVKTADGYIGAFVRDDIELGLLYRFPGGTRYADAWEVAHGSNDRAELEKEAQG